MKAHYDIDSGTIQIWFWNACGKRKRNRKERKKKSESAVRQNEKCVLKRPPKS